MIQSSTFHGIDMLTTFGLYVCVCDSCPCIHVCVVYNRYLNDIYTLEIREGTSLQWVSPTIEGECPNPRESHSAITYGSKLVVFGGMNGRRLGDTWIMDIGEGNSLFHYFIVIHAMFPLCAPSFFPTIATVCVVYLCTPLLAVRCDAVEVFGDRGCPTPAKESSFLMFDQGQVCVCVYLWFREGKGSSAVHSRTQESLPTVYFYPVLS